MNKLRQWFSKLWTILKKSINRFPETLVISLVMVIIMILDNHQDFDQEQLLIKITLILVLGIPLSATVKLIIERYKRPLIYRLGSIVLILAYIGVFYLLIPEELEQRFMIRYGFATAIAYFLFTMVPYLWQKKWYGLYCVKLIVSFFVTYLYTLVLYLGVIAIIFAVDFLFDLDISEKIYFDTFVAAVGLFGLTYFLGKIPAVNEDISYYRFPVVLKVLLVSIVVPLISIYTLVLHAYLIRVVVSIGWTDNFVSQLVIWYGFVSVVLMILLYPVKKESKIVEAFYKYYPFAMIIPMGMLLTSMVIRVQAYGLTVLRAFVLLAWLWFVMSIVYVLLRKGKASQLLVLTFSLLFGLTVFAPMNVFTISDNNQINRLTVLLEEQGLLVNGEVVINNETEEDVRIHVSNIIEYLDDYGGLNKVPYLKEDFTTKDMQEVFGFNYSQNRYYTDEFGQTYVGYYMDTYILTEISEYMYHISVTSRYGDEEAISTEGISVTGDDERLTVSKDGQVLFNEKIDQILLEEDVPVTYDEGGQPIVVENTYDWGKMKLVFTEINGVLEDDVLEVNHFRVHVFLTLDEER